MLEPMKANVRPQPSSNPSLTHRPAAGTAAPLVAALPLGTAQALMGLAAFRHKQQLR